MSTPWWRHAALYHIYPTSFADANGDGYGDLKGIQSKLDYLVELGVGAIWLSPIYRSPMIDWGYDVADYCDIDPRFGTLKDFDELLKAIHDRGLKLLLDFVPNHTSEQHDWFKQARRSRTSPKRDWYIWADPKPDGSPPNNWLSVFGGPAWTLDETTGQYYLHTFFKEQPDLNWRHAEVQQAMQETMRFWLRRGVDGFRTDSVMSLLKDAQLRDDPPNPHYRPGFNDPYDSLLHHYSQGQHETLKILATFCDVLADGDDEHDHYLVSEAYLGVPGLHQLYNACRKHPVHAPFNFNLMGLPWSAAAFGDFINTYEESLGPHDWPNYVLGNHDRHRLVSRLGAARSRLMAMLQFTLRGLPVVYYGEELGMTDGVIAHHHERDPLGILVPGLGLGRDPERTPMQWKPGRYGGFSRHSPWLPVGANVGTVNVESETKDPRSFLNLYRRLVALRTQSSGLLEGSYRQVASGNPDVLAYTRTSRRQKLLVVLNFSNETVPLKVEGVPKQLLLSTHARRSNVTTPLAPHEGRIYGDSQ